MLDGLLVGGRFDGGRLRPNARGTFVWVGEPRGGSKRGDFTVYAKRGRDRELYRSLGVGQGKVEGVMTDVELFLFAGHTYSLCACGAFIERSQLAMHAACHEAAA